MYIKSYKSKRFAGLRDVEVDFERGINVILGPNESGKSTIIDGIHSTLFKDTKLRNNNNKDKDFSFKYMPKPSGDFINGRLVMGIGEDEIEIYKEWGSSEDMHLVDEDGSIIKNKKDINEEIRRILNYGESTYSNIVFAKQRDLKTAIDNIIKDSDITSEVNDLLRQTMMELDGISIDRIEKNIEEEIENLYKRWDRDKNYPENNRGINNPYKTGKGEILENYYKKEGLKLSMEEAYKSEKEFENICNEIKELKDKRETLNTEKIELEDIEEDINSRALLEAESRGIDGELKELAKANREWPMTEELVRQIDEKLEALKSKRENLNEEKLNIEKCKRKETLAKKLKRLEEIENQIGDIEESIYAISSIEKGDIDRLKSLKSQISDLEISMEASKMLARLKVKSGGEVYIRRDFEDREVLEVDKEVEANGLINISYKDEFEIEIKTGDMDFEELSNRYKALKSDYEKTLQTLKVDSLDEAQDNFESIKSKTDEKKSLERELKLLVEDQEIEDLKSEFKELESLTTSRPYDEIEEELECVNREQIELSSDKRTKENQISTWEEHYRDHDNLFELVVDEKSKLKEKNGKLENLKPLPERFEDTEDFKTRLRYLKEETSSIDIKLESLSADQYEARASLLDDTYEELKKEFIDAEAAFEKNVKRGEKLFEIKRVFLKTKQELSSDPMKSLVAEFRRLLDIITDGSYKDSAIDEEFDIRLENKKGEIPIELLSAGTYDAVTLALRFSLLKHIFKDQSGYVVLDDCLVDLDPERKIQSINLINDFSKDYQVIFTTCDPETARMLGGNIIRI